MSGLTERSVNFYNHLPEGLNTYVFNSHNFYANICHMCTPSSNSYLGHSRDNLIRCDKCNMISYCGEKHKKQHEKQHQDLCKVIQKLLKTSGSTNLFGFLKKLKDPDERLNEKYKLISSVEKELKRKLYKDEKQMFLFPRLCNACLETDPDLLKNCGSCPQVCLCTFHFWGESIHATMSCVEYRLCFNLDYAIQVEARLIKESRYELDRRYDIYCVNTNSFPLLFPNPESFEPLKDMEFFMDYIEKGKTKIMTIFENTYWQCMCSQLYTNTLTLMHAIRKLDLEVQSQMVIHIVGIHDSRRKIFEIHELLLHLFPQLKILKVIAIGEELKQDDLKITRQIGICHKCLMENKVLFIESVKVPYVDYVATPAFETPQFIITYNFGDSEVLKWDESLLKIMEEIQVPFVMTTSTELRAKKQYKKIKERFGHLKRMSYYELNNFASLRPYRDARENNLKYENEYFSVFTLLQLPSNDSPNSSNSDENIEESLESSPDVNKDASDKSKKKKKKKKKKMKNMKKSNEASNPDEEKSSLDKEEILKDIKEKDVPETLGSQSNPTEKDKSKTDESSEHSEEEDELEDRPKKTTRKIVELKQENEELNAIIIKYLGELPKLKKCTEPVALDLLEEHFALKICLDDLEKKLLEAFN